MDNADADADADARRPPAIYAMGRSDVDKKLLRRAARGSRP